MSGIQIAASLLSANSMHYYDDIHRALDAGIDRLHFDVMDQHFVPNLTFGPSLCRDIRKSFPDLIIDVHAMTYHVMDQAIAFVDAGASSFTFHAHATNEPIEILEYLKVQKVVSGLAINPDQSLDQAVGESMDSLGMVLVMSVMPGFAGQAWMPSSLNTLKKCKELKKKYSFVLAVDGGINQHTCHDAISAGAEILVSGSYLYHHPCMKDAVTLLRG